ncbi:MAG: MlaD family protein [Solirubrobacteraceae bacterium]
MSSSDERDGVSRQKKAVGVLTALAGAAVAIAAIVIATAAGGGNGGYRIRAIFAYAANVSTGEDVKIAGVPVGTVEEVTVTPHGLAAVSVAINRPGYQDFRVDASCTVRPESLLGEKYVECNPTQPRGEGTPLPPALPAIPHGREGAGEHLVTIAHTESPVEVDQLQDITRAPEAQKLRIILNELGVGFAARGPELHAAIVRANPGLRELDKVLRTFANQNAMLANLAEESNRALAPIARNRGSVAGFVEHSSTVAKASARQYVSLRRDLAKLPAFLEQLGPASARLGRFAEQAQPTFESLRRAARPVDEAFKQLGPFSNSSNRYLTSLGSTGRRTGHALKGIEPLLSELSKLGGEAGPFSGNLEKTLVSLRKTGGLERIMDFIFLGAGATNGYDALGHFLRAEVIGSNCVSYYIKSTTGCSANFFNEPSSSSSSASTGKAARFKVPSGVSATMARTLAVLDGATPAEAIAAIPDHERGAATHASPPSSPAGGNAAGETKYAPAAESPRASERLLEYLLGS